MNTTEISQPKETYEQWRLRNYGNRGSIREALTHSESKLFCASYDRSRVREIADLADRSFKTTVGRHLDRAAKAQAREVRKNAHAAIWWALVAQVRFATGARLT
jgi:hypothetical protein